MPNGRNGYGYGEEICGEFLRSDRLSEGEEPCERPFYSIRKVSERRNVFVDRSGAQIVEAWGKRRSEAPFASKLTDADAEQYEHSIGSRSSWISNT